MEENQISRMPSVFLEELKDNPAVTLLDQEKGTLPLASFMEEAIVLATSYLHKPRPILVVKQNLYHAQRLYDRLATLLSQTQCALFAADESLRVQAIASSPEMLAQRVETLSSLLDHPNQIVITSPSGFLRHLPFPQDFQKGCFTLTVGQTIEMEELKERLRSGGYFQTSHIDQPLSFAFRGGIVDVYSINQAQPIRVEFFDNEIESIRTFDITTQKTLESISSVSIVPASDLLFTSAQIKEITKKCKELLEKGNHPILEEEVNSDLSFLENHIQEPHLYTYFPFLEKTGGIWEYMKDPLVIYSEKAEIEQNIHKLIEDTTSYIQEMVQEKKLLPKYAMWHDFSRCAMDCKKMEEDSFADNISGIQQLHLPNETLANKLKLIDPEKRVLFCLKDNEVQRVMDACIEAKQPYKILQEGQTLSKGYHFCLQSVYEGFLLSDKNLVVVTGNELFEIHHHEGRYEKKFKNAEIIHSYQELEPGDYIVHAQHGVGQYLGIETREIQGTMKDFLRVIYRGNAELLVPLEQFRLVRKFISREGVVPRLSKLGSDEWEKTKARLEENVNNLAERLLELYTNRKENIGHAYSPDTEETKKFENEFAYTLTPDQEKAVEDVKKDMESTKPMDRLICGDVGFGKTEVAVRASFKAVSDGKQVAVLCPTTILAEQHFRTFHKRFENEPVTVKVLDRFVPASVQKQILKDVQSGAVDILIGTHRILSKDVTFKDLGLLVVDEEQRFGVEHKEKIKEMKNGIDVLSLSATPIPRTLQMSLVGVRPLSTLDTPPENRYSVQTYVVEKSEGLVKDAIEKELARQGQVFYLYNNIEQIYNIARRIQGQIPEANVGVVHGQMDRDTIEDTMMRFNNHQLDVLVCTTIIENGIDIPNVNTILIDNAHEFGLAQIYQIKGRVGRSDRVAYAYLMIPGRKQLSEVAQKRLQAVKEFAKLGSGYKLAMRDLTIRGAGDLLGPDQSGFIDTVGIDMYMEMLEEAIQRKQGKLPKLEEVPQIKANVQENTYIPKQFAPDDFDKIELYKKIDATHTEKALHHLEKDVMDEYGNLPKEVRALFLKKRLEILLNDSMLDGYREVKGHSEITFSKEFSDTVDGVKLFEIINQISKDITLRYTGGKIIVLLPKQKENLPMVISVVDRAKEAVKHAD